MKQEAYKTRSLLGGLWLICGVCINQPCVFLSVQLFVVEYFDNTMVVLPSFIKHDTSIQEEAMLHVQGEAMALKNEVWDDSLIIILKLNEEVFYHLKDNLSI